HTVMVGFQLLGRLECSVETGGRELGEKGRGYRIVDLPPAELQAPFTPSVTYRVAGTIIAEFRIATPGINAQVAPPASPPGYPLQERRALSHRSSSLVRTWMGVLRQPRLIRLERCPVDKAAVMATNDDGPFRARQVPHAFAYSSSLVNITLTTSF